MDSALSKRLKGSGGIFSWYNTKQVWMRIGCIYNLNEKKKKKKNEKVNQITTKQQTFKL